MNIAADKLGSELKILARKLPKTDMTPPPVWFWLQLPFTHPSSSPPRQRVRENGDDIPTRADCHGRHLGRSAHGHDAVWTEKISPKKPPTTNPSAQTQPASIRLICSYTIHRKQRGCLSTISENQTMLECVSFHTVEPAINPRPFVSTTPRRRMTSALKQ